MDPLSVIASVIGVAGAGLKLSLAPISLAETVGTAAESMKMLSDDIYITCGILYGTLLYFWSNSLLVHSRNQIKDVVTPKVDSGGRETCIFSVQGAPPYPNVYHQLRNNFQRD